MSWPMLNEKRFDGTPAGGFEYNKDITIVIDKVMNVKPYHFYGPDSSTSDPANPADIGKRHLLWSLSHEETMHCHLSPESLKALCNGGRFGPEKKLFTSRAPLVTNPIVNPMARAKVFEAIKFTFGNRLWIKHEDGTHRYIIFPNKRYLTKPTNRIAVNPTAVDPTYMRPRVAPKHFEQTGETLDKCVTWDAWAVDAKKHDDSFREAQQYQEDQKKREERAAAFAKTTVEIDPSRHHFKQTVVKTESKVENKVEVTKVDTEKPAFIPPHLRKKMAAAAVAAENKTE